MYVCSYPDCGKAYVNNSILKRHVQAFHLSVKKFQCSFCEKCLASRQNLKEHMYIHTGEKPYVCTFPGCSASFRQGTHLSAHKRFDHASPPESDENSPYTINLNYLISLMSSKGRLNEQYFIKEDTSIVLPMITQPYKCSLPNIFLVDTNGLTK